MTSENGNILTMPVAPAGYSGGGGFGNGWGSDIWIILLVLFALGGFGGYGGFGGGFGGGNLGGILYPWMNVNENTNAGFQAAATNSAIASLQNSVTSGFGDVQNALCGGFAGVNANIANGFAQSEIAANSRQMANMNQIFGLSQQFSDCCCENRLANCQTQNLIQNEGNATRFADANNTRDIIQSQNDGVKAVLDKLCQLELDGKNDRIADLERQLTMANLAASQTAQTSRILADNAAQTVALEQYLNPVPIPAYMVQNPNCCNQNYGCGCGNF